MVRRKLLRKYILNFSTKYDILEADTDTTPPYGYTAAFYIPADCVRILALGDLPAGDPLYGQLYDIAEAFIYTSSDDSGDLKIRYSKDAQNVEEFDPVFVECLILSLAQSMAKKFTMKPSLANALKAELDDATEALKAIAGQERPPVRIERSRLKNARRYGRDERGRDYSRYP